ncbi:MAG: hypothetical protein ACRDG2_10565 [Actinomycetota bacterium]
MEPTPDEVANVTRALRRLGGPPAAWRAVTDGGHTPARRWVVTLDDGPTAFVKVATDELTASWIRDEHTTYSALRGAAFMPRFIGFHDDGEQPVLALEDLSSAAWPPPWSTDRIDSVLRCLSDVAATSPRRDFRKPPSRTASVLEPDRARSRAVPSPRPVFGILAIRRAAGVA